jgi:ribosomal protein S27E
MSGPRLNVSRTVKCPCGHHEVKGTVAAFVAASHTVSCWHCGRVLREQEPGSRGRARFAFVHRADLESFHG